MSARAICAECPRSDYAEQRAYSTDILAKMQRSGSAETLIVGDSIAERWSTLGERTGGSVDNWGVSQDRPENLLWRLEQVRAPHHWRSIILIVGVNAAFRSPRCRTVAGAIEADVVELQRISPGSVIFVVGVMPYRPGLAPSLEQTRPINAALRSDARGRVSFVDAGQTLLRTCLDRKQCPLLVDWLHPSEAGYDAIWKAIRTVASARGQIR